MDTPVGELPVLAGSLAVKCPACPWPGINLDEGWENDMVKLWKYMLYLAIDANFQLIRLDFCAHITEYGKRIPFDPSDCQDHEAIKLATTKQSAGLATSSVGTMNCARHDCKNPSTVTILDYGEEQVCMDYIFCGRLQHLALHCVVVSYDINCQWLKKLWERMDIYPMSMRPQQAPADFVYLIPKFHLPAHIPSCHMKYSFYKTLYVGETDSEAPEYRWSRLNPLPASLKVMGPGGYLDMLDDHISDYNYRKTTLISTTLLKAVKEAIPSQTLHAAIYAEFTASLPHEEVLMWMKAVEEWKIDPIKKVNLFDTMVAHEYHLIFGDNDFSFVLHSELTTNKVCLTLTQEEAAEMAKVVAAESQPVEQSELTQTPPWDSPQDADAAIFVIQHETGPSAMILQGVKLENDQCRLRLAYTALGMHLTDRKQSRVQEGLNWMHWHLDIWFEIQQLYMLGVASLCTEWNKTQLAAKVVAAQLAAAAAASIAANVDEEPQNSRKGQKPHKHRAQAKLIEEALEVVDIPLFLPSNTFNCIQTNRKLADFEFCLHEAETYECLMTLCRLLIYRSHIYKFKDLHITGQLMSMRARSTIKSIINNIDKAADRYCKLRDHLVTLAAALDGGKDGWD
ncbi:hypothetical protein EDD85DRAFT_958034 [Armillaria nabsnona]|nr:hypothetical protein EDD85DRAFT_958034 [Armillaria nabsnona]